MSRFWLIFLSIAVMVLLLFGLAIWWGHPIFTDPLPYIGSSGPAAMIISCLLLAGDVVLPVPSSIVMIANGAMFGTMIGTLVSLTGGVLAAYTGWFLGRWGSRWVTKYAGESSMMRAKQFMDRWGFLAILLSRPIPVLAETIAIMTGSLNLSPMHVGLYSAAGLIAPCLIYAYAGSRASDAPSTWQTLLWVVGVAGLMWLVTRKMGSSKESRVVSQES
jgi:uncharacterized membrane protein YdjX (TVP38/TMEM64 family)